MLLLCFPFIQLGLSFYQSIQLFAFFIAFFLIPVRILTSFLLLGLPLFLLMCLPVIFTMNSNYAEHDFLKTGREFLCYTPMFCIIKHKNSFLKEIKISPIIKKTIPLLILFLLAFTIIQTIYLKKGVYLSFPYQYFITNFGTLPKELDLKYSRIRPAATFGEPSYLGFILSSLLVLVLRIYENSWYKHAMIGCIVIAAYLCMSASGQFAILVLLFIYFMQLDIKAFTKFSIITLAFLLLASAWTFTSISSFSTVDRFSNILDKKKESSGYYRLAAPAVVVYQVLFNSPIGVTNSELGKFIISNKDMSRRDLLGALSNGLYNILINYGITGILLLILLFIPIWKDWLIMAYIFLSTMFNGAFLAFDKASIIVTTLYVLFYFSAEIKSKLSINNV